MRSEYIWMFFVFLFALNIIGPGNDFQVEFQLIWLLLALLGWELSSKKDAKCVNDEVKG